MTRILQKFHFRCLVMFVAGALLTLLCVRGGTVVSIGAVFLSMLAAVVGVLIPTGPRGQNGPMGKPGTPGPGVPWPIPDGQCFVLVAMGGVQRWLPIGQEGETFSQIVRRAREGNG